jgi:hypothetical protein
MTKYRMRVFCSGNSEPRLWHTHDIFAQDDEAAKIAAQQRYDELVVELVRSKADLTLVNFSLCGEGDRLVCETPRRDHCLCG